MAGGSLGTIRGQIRLDVASAIAAYATVRAANARTINTMNDASNRMRGFGLAATGMGAAFLTGFGMAVNAAADFEKKLDYFGAVSAATDEEMQSVRDTVLDLGTTTAFSASQIADAVVEMGKAGVKASDITDGMAEAIINLASAADIELGQATDIVTSAMQAYELKATDAAHITDVMAGAANASIIDVTDLGVSMKYVAGVANGLGISFDSTVDAISLLGKAGIKGSTAGTSLRQIMVSLAGGTDKAKGVLEELGIITEDGSNKFFTAEGRAKSLAEVFQILQDHTADMSDKQRIAAFRTIFNNRALAAASILTREGAAGFAEMNAEIGKVSAADVATERLDNLSGDIHKLRSAFETFMIKGGTPFQEFLRQIVQGLTAVVTWFGNLPSGVQTSIFSFMLVAGVLLMLVGSFALLGSVMMRGIGAMRSVGGAFRLLTGIMRTLTVATWAQTVAALSNPYVLIAMAVIALVVALVLLYQRSEKFREIMDAIGRGIKDGFLAVVDWFKGLPKWFSDRWSEIADAFGRGVDWVRENWDVLLTVITGPFGAAITIVRRFGDDIINFVAGIPGQVAGFFVWAFNAFLDFMGQLPARIGFIIGFILGRLILWAGLLGVWAINTGKQVVDALMWWFFEMPVMLAELLAGILLSLVTWGINMVTSAIQTGINIYNGIVEWFQRLPGRTAELATNTVNGVKAKWDQALTWSRNFARDSYNGIINWFQRLPGRTVGLVTDTYNGMVNKGQEMVSWAAGLGSDLYNGVIDTVDNLPGEIGRILQNCIDAFLDVVGSAWDAAKDFAGGLWEGFKSGLGIASPSYIEHAMWAITGVAQEETQRLRGQVRGIQTLGRNLAGVDMVPWASTENQARMANFAALASANTSQLMGYASMFTTPADAGLIGARGASNASSEGSGTGLENSQNQRPIIVKNYNPVAERGSDSAARNLRLLSDMGAFG